MNQTELNLLVELISSISCFAHGTNYRPYTRLSGPITIKFPQGEEETVWQCDFEPGISYWLSRWEAFANYKAFAFSKFFHEVIEGETNMKTREANIEDLPIMKEIIHDAERFSFQNGFCIHGPYRTLSEEVCDKDMWFVEYNLQEFATCFSFGDALKIAGFEEMTNVFEQFV